MGNLNKNSWGFIFALISAVFWGTYGTFLKLMGDAGFKGMTIAAMSPTIVISFFLAKILFNQPKALFISKKILALIALHGIFITSGITFCYVQAVSALPVGIVSIISFCHIIFLMITTRIVFGYQITRKKVAVILIVLVGLSLVLEVYQVAGSLNLAGVMWAALGALLVALGATLFKYYLTRGIEATAVFFYTNFFAALTLWCATPLWEIARETVQLTSVHGYRVWLILLGFALLPLVGSYLLYGKAYERIEPTYVSLMYSLDPVTATILGFLLLDQNLHVMQLIGMGIILLPVCYIQYMEGKEPDGGEKITDHPPSVGV
ncbi:DMT family transporter [Candidatus Formimonas warabiya]|uniref:EamA domain-containing protein n=1 Tax=Formimonas warabiya TaxID=1761012 RepID=A0A3G1L0P3_FORW1|nr:DMT family transporter [Candidatus Formimonas warabiya]ATW28237.1 hypothetical protein DCMF_28865 [Candidatus Formimonas warabiya]